MRNTSKPTVDLATAVRAVAEHAPQPLTLAELVRAYDSHACAAETFRLRKWLGLYPINGGWALIRHG